MPSSGSASHPPRTAQHGSGLLKNNKRVSPYDHPFQSTSIMSSFDSSPDKLAPAALAPPHSSAQAPTKMTNSQLATILSLNSSLNPSATGAPKTIKSKRKSVVQMNPHALYGPKQGAGGSAQPSNMSPLR